MATINYSGQLVVLTCWCGIRHAVPEELRRQQRRQQDEHREVTGVFCPLGHEHVPSGKSKAAKLQERLDAERVRSGRLAHERDQAEARRIAQKGATTRAKKRHAAGVCPVCTRTFKQLARHMESQHPGYDPSE